MTIKKKLYHLIGRKTSEEKIRTRIKMIKQLVEEKRPKGGWENEINGIKKDFYLDGLTVANKNGEILKSNGAEQDFREVIEDTGLHEYITQELPEAEVFTLRKKGQNHILYIQGDKVYFMKTPGSVSTPEIKRITQRINNED